MTPPASLLVDSDLDGITVTLGPARRMLVRAGPLVIALSLVGGWVLGGTLGPVVASVLSLAGAMVGGVLRVRGWVKHEAPLELRLQSHHLQIRRVFMGRLLWSTDWSLADIEHVAAMGDTLQFEVAGRRVDLVAGYRSEEELAWVADFVQKRANHEGGRVQIEALDALTAQR